MGYGNTGRSQREISDTEKIGPVRADESWSDFGSTGGNKTLDARLKAAEPHALAAHAHHLAGLHSLLSRPNLNDAHGASNQEANL